MSSLVFPLSALGAYVQSREPYTGVRVDEVASGKEYRSTWQALPRYKYRVVFEVVRSDAGSRVDFQRVSSFFSRHFGQLDSFLFVDTEDYTLTDHGFGVGDAVTTPFQLQRSHVGSVDDLLGGPWSVSSKPRTNLITFSAQLDNAAWTKTSSSATPNAAIAPDGTATAEKLVEAAATAVHKIASANVAVTSGKKYMLDCFLQAGERTTAVIDESLGGTRAVFDLAAGTTSSAGASIFACGNGWYRCCLGFTAGSSANTNLRIYPNTDSSYAGDGTSGIYVWGAMLEQSTTVSQYIPTTSTAVTSTPNYWPNYTDGFEPVYDLQPNGLLIYIDGVLKTLTTDYTISAAGLVTFTSPPGSGAVLSWTGNYFRRVRLLNDNLSFARIVKNMWSASVDLVSVLP